MSIQIREYNPGERLRNFIELVWEGDFNTTLEHNLRQRVVPNGYVELIIHLTTQHCDLFKKDRWTHSPDYTIIGLYTRPYEVQFRDLVKVFGIRFKPEGIYNVFGIPASEFNQSYEDMELVLGVKFREYCNRLRDTEQTAEKLKITEDFLMKCYEQNDREFSYLNRAAEIIRNSDSHLKIENLPDEVYISLRQLERVFKQKIGITPKRYMRISRLNEVHRKLEENQQLDFTKVAFDCGYSDQAHFIRDFKSFMGVKPTIFVKDRQKFIVNTKTSGMLS